MERYELSLAGKLDAGLVKALCALLGWLKNLSLWVLGLSMLLGAIWMIFEYDEGLADISWHEWGFLLLLPLLLWRHARYCQCFAIGFWRGLSRLLIFQGILGIVTLSGTGLLVALLLESESLDSFLRYMAQGDPISELVGYGLTLLVVYLAAPASAGSPASQQAAPARIEPTVSPMAKEASL